jgi:surface protein
MARPLNAVIHEWPAPLPEDLLLLILSHLDASTLIEKKQVCRIWRHACTEVIDAKQTFTTRKVFTSNEELRKAVKKYCGFNQATWHSTGRCTPKGAEEFAQTYGYPINKCDVSNLQDFSHIFNGVYTFNEDISSWDVSRATTMEGMFKYARNFDQDLSCWNVSNVTDMSYMFGGTLNFNQNLSRWNVSNVENMTCMFRNAKKFDQDIESWELWDSSKLL